MIDWRSPFADRCLWMYLTTSKYTSYSFSNQKIYYFLFPNVCVMLYMKREGGGMIFMGENFFGGGRIFFSFFGLPSMFSFFIQPSKWTMLDFLMVCKLVSSRKGENAKKLPPSRICYVSGITVMESQWSYTAWSVVYLVYKTRERKKQVYYWKALTILCVWRSMLIKNLLERISNDVARVILSKNTHPSARFSIQTLLEIIPHERNWRENDD